MDIKSRKSSKLAKLIITLAVLLPALILVCLYPRMEEVMLKEREEYENRLTETSQVQDMAVVDMSGTVVDTAVSESIPETNGMSSVKYNFVNYAVESSYYLYGKMLQEAKQREINFEILDQYGWINDFYTLAGATAYYAEYQDEKGTFYEDKNSELLLEFLLNDEEQLTESYVENLRDNNVRGYLTIEFDRYGKLAAIEFVNLTDLEYDTNLYQKARDSVEQYIANAEFYTNPYDEAGESFDEALAAAKEVIPKNFKAVFALTGSSTFVEEYSDIFENVYDGAYYWYYHDPVYMYLEMGALFIVIAMAAVVAVVALILPFFKKLNTGWEKLFCMPFEIICCVVPAGIAGAYFMFDIMCHSTFTEIEQAWGHAEILGYPIEDQTVYWVVLVLNFIGWATLFLAEYIAVSSFRQFLCNPIAYMKYRLLGIVFIRWIGRQCKRFFRYMTDIDINGKLHSSIVKIVILNGILVAILCCGWFVGAVGAVVYSMILYVILRNRGKKIQEQYNSILHATEQMAEGELKIQLKEDLGMFAPLGRELEQVQEGFAKAVAEEAKSQSMKTELISNVSHDLKTPLTAIITYVNLLKQPDNTPEQQQNYIQTLDMKSQRLKVLIEDLFEVSKAQSGNIQMEFMDVDVVSLMKQVRLEMEDKIADSNLVFRWNLPEEKVVLSLDGQKTYRIFENLISNSLKYAMPHSRVYVDIISTEQEVQIVFKNISATELNTEGERLTERFVRGDASRNSEGSGLGLAIVKSFTELQNGTFRIDIDGDLFKAVLTWKK